MKIPARARGTKDKALCRRERNGEREKKRPAKDVRRMETTRMQRGEMRTPPIGGDTGRKEREDNAKNKRKQEDANEEQEKKARGERILVVG